MKKFLLVCFSFAFALSALAQDRVVSGKVTSSEDGSALPGVNVILKGNTNGTVTDADGNFKLTVPSGGGSLMFSFIGFSTQEVEIGDRTMVDIQLGSDQKQLNEVVVTAQGIQQEKRALGYAVTTVSGSLVQQRPEQDIGRLLSGKIPGVNITSTGGLAGQATNIVIRGYTTISGSKSPLWVVDGIPFDGGNNPTGGNGNSANNFLNGGVASSSRFLDLDPNNIEKVDVLKGLSASVLYGERGKNGVILVTTKNGNTKRGDRFEINLNQSVYASKIASLPDYQGSYGDGFQQAYGPFFSNWGPSYAQLDSVPHPYSQFSDPALQAAFPQFVGKNVKYEPHIHSVRDFFNTGLASNTSLNLNGAKDNVNYNVSIGRTHENGFVPNNVLEKINFGAGVNVQVTKKLGVSTSINYAATDFKTPPMSAATGSGIAGGGESVYSDVLYTPVNIDLMHLPYESPLDHRSVYYRTGNDIQNPRWTANYTKQTDNVRRFFGKTQLTYNLAKDLMVTYRTSLDTYNELTEYVVNKGGPQNINGFYRTQNTENTTWNQDFLVSYNHQFGDFNLSATVGSQYRTDQSDASGMYSSNQIVFGFVNHNNFIAHSNIDGLTGVNLNTTSNQRYTGVYGTATLGYKDFLYLTAADRNDWTTKLEKANRSINYPSVGLSFIPTQAFTALESDKLNLLKLRANYGTSASLPSPYNTRSYLNSTARGFIDKGGAVVTTNSLNDNLGNPNLKPELLKELEFGVEAKMFNNRLNIDFSYYNRTSTNLISNIPLDPATGYTSTTINIGKITNTGIELAINGVLIQSGPFHWDATLNFNHYQSLVNTLGSGVAQVPVAGYSNLGNFAIPGMPFNEIMGNYVVRDANGNKTVGADGNYVISHDVKPIGNPNPKFTSSILSNFSWKGINLFVQIDYRKGGAIYSTTESALLARGTTQDSNFNRDAVFVLPGVQADGSKNTVALTSSDLFFNNYGFGANELNVYDGTTIRLSNITLSYNLPKSIVSKTPFKGVSFALNGQNLWYKAVNFPKHSHFDTNQLSTGVGNGLGMDFLAGPSARKYGVTLGLKF